MRSKVSLHTAWPFSTMKGTSWARTSSAAPRSTESPGRIEPEPRIEEPGVVRTELAAGRVVRGHFGGQIGGDADRLVRHQEIEALRGQDETITVLPEDGVPERHGINLSARSQIKQWRAVPGAVPNLTPLVAPQIESQKEPVRKNEVVDRDRRARLVEDRLLEVGLSDLVIAEPRTADRQAELVERQVLPDTDGEREGNDLQVEGPLVARRHLVESVAVVRDHPREDVDSARRTLGVGLASQPGREIEPLLQLNEVRTPGFEHGAIATEVDFVEDVVLQLPLDRIVPWQKAAADAQGPLPEAKVQAGRLHVGLGDVEAPRIDVAGADGPLQQLPRQDPFGQWLEVQHHGTRRGWRRLPGTHRAKHVASCRERPRVGTASGTACGRLGEYRGALGIHGGSAGRNCRPQPVCPEPPWAISPRGAPGPSRHVAVHQPSQFSW